MTTFDPEIFVQKLRERGLPVIADCVELACVSTTAKPEYPKPFSKPLLVSVPTETPTPDIFTTPKFKAGDRVFSPIDGEGTVESAAPDIGAKWAEKVVNNWGGMASIVPHVSGEGKGFPFCIDMAFGQREQCILEARLCVAPWFAAADAEGYKRGIQQSLIVLRSLEWSSRVGDQDGRPCSICPSCKGINPSDPVSRNFRDESHGHREGCKLNEAILGKGESK